MCPHTLSDDQTLSRKCQTTHWVYSYDLIQVKVQILLFFIIKQVACIKPIEYSKGIWHSTFIKRIISSVQYKKILIRSQLYLWFKYSTLNVNFNFRFFFHLNCCCNHLTNCFASWFPPHINYLLESFWKWKLYYRIPSINSKVWHLKLYCVWVAA